jgi:hypothetical protein
MVYIMKISKKGIEFDRSFDHELLYVFMDFAKSFLDSKCSGEYKKLVGEDVFKEYKKISNEIFMSLGSAFIEDSIIKHFTENLKNRGI